MCHVGRIFSFFNVENLSLLEYFINLYDRVYYVIINCIIYFYINTCYRYAIKGKLIIIALIIVILNNNNWQYILPT